MLENNLSALGNTIQDAATSLSPGATDELKPTLKREASLEAAPVAKHPTAAADPFKKLSSLAINDEGFAFDPRTGESFTVNHTGRQIIQTLLKGEGETAAIEQLTKRFSLDAREVRRDVRDFLEQLRALRLLEGGS